MHNRLSNYENNILLIEDNPGDARLVEILLEESDLYDCEIVNKTTLADGLEALAEDSYSAVLLDLTLPDSKGFETLEQLLHQFPETNVIVLTGLANKELGIKAVKAGAQDFLAKGDFDSDLLSKSLRYSIERNSVLSRLEEAQRIAHIGNWEFNLETRSFVASDEVYRIFGYNPKKITITEPLLLKHVVREDRKILQTISDKAVANEHVLEDLRIKDHEGKIRHISVLCSGGKNRKTIHSITGIVQDITDRKLAEQALLKSQERYQAIFSQSKDAIYISSDTRFIDFNHATEKLFGYSEAELKALDITTLYKLPEQKVALEVKMQTSSFVKDFEIEILRKDGTSRHCLLTSSKISTDDFEGNHGILRDITGRKQTEELRKAKEIAERSAKMKEKFLANVSHEMRTPMNAVLGLTNLLLKTSVDEEQHNYLHSIKESSQHLLGIINDILEFSSLNEGKVQFEEKEFNLYELVHNLVGFVKFRAEEKGLILKSEIDTNVDKILVGDQLRLQQVLTNLLANAVKFTEKGFVKVNIHKVREVGKTVTLRFDVIDSGIGISKDKIEVIFETFTRVFDPTVKQYSGTGLGLAIVKQLVQLQGGSIHVSSELGEGSTFSCEMHFKKADVKPVVKLAEERVTLQVDRDVHILLVEDHKLNQIVARKTLEKEWPNIKVTIADNGKIAIDKLRKQDFDIILMDIQMPVMDGYEATKYIRQNLEPKKANTTIFAMTAHAHMAQDEKYREYGMDDCVLKPFEPKQLFNKIATYVNKKAKEPMNANTNINNSSIKIIDLSYMDLMADGDDDMKKIMLELLFEEPVEEIKSMYRLHQASDWSSLKKVSHKMKSTLAFVGNDTLTNTNKEIEQIAMKERGIQKLPNLISTLDEMYQRALVELKQEYAKLG